MKVAFVILFLATSGFSRAAPEYTLQAASSHQDAQLTDARGLLAKSQLLAAEQAVRRSIALRPQVPEGYFLLGLILFREVQTLARSSGNYLSAGDVPSNAIDPRSRDERIRASLAAFTEGAKYGKPSSDDLKIVAMNYVLLEDFASADKWLTLALDWNPGDSENWYYLGRVKYSENRFDEAIAAFQKCLELRPKFVLAANGLGLSYAGLNQVSAAADWLHKAIDWQEATKQLTPEPFTDLGDLLSQQGKFEEALPALQRAVEIDPGNIRAHEKLGKILLTLNRLDDAQRELVRVTALDPNLATPHYLLGQVYRKQGRLAQAKTEMERFQQLKAKEPPRKSGMQ